MSTETSPSKPIQISVATAHATESPKAAVCCTTTHDDQPRGEKLHCADKAAVAPAAAHPKTEPLPKLLADLAAPESARRAVAAAALGHLKDIAAAPALIAALRDSDAEVAREAAAALGSIGSAAAVEPLIAVVTSRDGFFHSVVRVAAAHSLGQLRDARAVVPLCDAISDPIAEVSAEAIRALVVLSDPRSIPALLEVVRNEHGFFLPSTRYAAILGLAQSGGEQAACELKFVASNQWEDATIRAAAIEATRGKWTSTTKA
jgi:HEAT repeat protein